MIMERRKSKRVMPEPHNPVEVQVMGNGFLEGVNAVNISVSGVGIYLQHGLDEVYVGSKVEIILSLPNCRPVFLRGRIRHLKGYDDPRYIGLEFTRLPPNVETLLELYVNKNRHRFVDPPAAAADN